MLEKDAFAYFRLFQPVARIGHSIYVYKLSQADVDAGRLAARALRALRCRSPAHSGLRQT